MKTITIANQKGGVGKTTTALALGIGLSRSGYKTLLVDLDPQGSLTNFLFVDTSSKPTVFEFLGILKKSRVSFENVVVQIESLLDLLPSDISLEEASRLLIGRAGAAVYLASALNEIKDNYDFCVIDTSPSLSMLTDNALTAANRIIVPVKPELASIKGVELLLQNIEEIKTLVPSLTIDGFLVTMLDRRRKSSGLTIETIEEIANTHSVYVYNSQIRSTASGACLGSGSLKIDGLPITDDYNKFVAEFLSRNKIDSKLEKAI